MANKFILVPEEIYRGLTSNDVGEPNLDFTRRNLEKSKLKRESESAKNVHYNQELRRYLHMRNERENKPVKVEMVANKKGVVVPKTRSRPSSYIPNNDENDDIWLSDDLSYSAYPREPPNFAYNIVPPLYESSASLPSNRQNLLNEGLSLSPTITRHGLKRSEQNNGETSKKLKLSKVTKSKIPIFKRKKQKKRVTVTPTVQQEINEPAAVSAPLRNSPPIPLTVSKRENDSNDFNVVKRIKKHDKARDKELLENDRELRRKEALRIDKKRKFNTKKK
uniref:Uncharacterized protein n=1 Tax=Meloidogyne enterolobii TaxID=390850 RepID=A0A6V7XZ91_MELEN|nr:unnamed protein product [Meloidogyne enterolobii]